MLFVIIAVCLEIDRPEIVSLDREATVGTGWVEVEVVLNTVSVETVTANQGHHVVFHGLQADDTNRSIVEEKSIRPSFLGISHF
jgi:Mlc titration factor MtfA (ptsG expression regulator)